MSGSQGIGQFAKHFKWYHWAGAFATVGAFNGGLLISMGKGYHWYYADDEDERERFRRRYGIPTEQQRFEAFAFMAEEYDRKISVVERSGASVYRNEHLAGQLRGDVLEVAVGTGQNFEAVREQMERGEARSYVGVDAVEAMLEHASPKLASLPKEKPASLQRADAQHLPFPDASFDTVVGTLCLCSVERPAAALNEMGRVCRPDGQVLLVEPGLANRWPVRAAQAYLNLCPKPTHAWEAGWYDDLDPPALIAACPVLSLASVTTRAMGNWYLIRATPKPRSSAIPSAEAA